MVLNGQVREVDMLGNDAADEAADFGRRRVGNKVIDARRNLSGVCSRWYPVLLDLHRFFIAVSRAVVNHDGGPGTAPDPSVWSAGTLPKRRRLVHAVRDRAFLPGPLGLWSLIGSIFLLLLSVLLILHFGPILLVSWLSGFLFLLVFTGLLVGLILALVVFLISSFLSCMSCGLARGSLEKAAPRYLRPGRPISVSAVPFGPGIDIWRSCRFIGALMRSLCLLPGGLGRFVTCSIGANHCRLRHTGWEKCGHGLTSRPRESASLHFLDELLALFRYPSGSGRALLAGTLPLRYCSIIGLPFDEVDRDVSWVSGSGPGRKRIRLNRKTNAHPCGVYVSFSS